MNRIRKILAGLLAAAMMVISAGASAESPLRTAFDAAKELAFNTGNVTIRGNADFRLDGARFKTAEVTYIQDGEDSFWQLKLFTPHEGDEERETGYTIVANGEMVYVMEAYTPGVYKTGTANPQSTILRNTVQLAVMTELAGVLADQADVLLGGNAVTSGEDGKGGTAVRVRAGEDVPQIVNTALNLAWEYVAKRYFRTDYDQLEGQNMGPLEAYQTPTQGILGATKYVALKQVDAEAVTDADGNLAAVSGSIALTLYTGRDETHLLNVSFRMEVSDRGTSRVRQFSPDDYGVVLAQDTMSYGQYDPEPAISEEEFSARVENGKALFAVSGYADAASMDGTSYEEDGRIFYEIWTNDDSLDVVCFTDAAGNLLSMSNLYGRWGDPDGKVYQTESDYPDMQLIRLMAERTLEWLGQVNPEARARVKDLELGFWYQDGEDLFFGFEEDEPSPDGQRVNMVVRVQPDWRVESYSCISNG